VFDHKFWKKQVLFSATNKGLGPNLHTVTDTLSKLCTLSCALIYTVPEVMCAQRQRVPSLSTVDTLQTLFRALTQTEGGFPSILPAGHVCPNNCQGREVNLYWLKLLCAESISVGQKKHRYVENELF